MALGPSFGSLERSLAVLEASEDVLKRHQKMTPEKHTQKVTKKCVIRCLWPIWWGGDPRTRVGGHGRAVPGSWRWVSVRSPK